jgi:hypothetical protein
MNQLTHPAPLSHTARLSAGLRAAESAIVRQDKVWSRFSDDKIDIARVLMRIIRVLHKSLPLDQDLAAVSFGSSSEPQFRILESAFRAGLWLVDTEPAALDTVAERIARQGHDRVWLVREDLTRALADHAAAAAFRDRHLGGNHVNLVTFHHSLYYAPRPAWDAIIPAACEELLAPGSAQGLTSALHAVVMAAAADDPLTTTSLYNRFAGRFFHAANTQDLAAFAPTLRTRPSLADARVLAHRSRVRFWVDDFGQFMGVVWMILLHPNVHHFSRKQQEEVIEWVYENLWSRGVPLVQEQDHLIVLRGDAIAAGSRAGPA